MRKVELNQGSPEWHAWRDNGIGGSDASICIGVNPWKTPYQLWREKLKLESSDFMNDAMRRGVALEPVARRNLSDHFGMEFDSACFESSTNTWMKASLDGISADHKVAVEIKCPMEPKEEKVPDIYYPQLQHQMAVLGLEWMYYYCHHPEKSFLLTVPRDDNFIKKMIEQEKRFWDCVESLVPPELRDKDYITRTEPDICKAALHLMDIQEKLEPYKKLLEQEKKAKEDLIKLTDGKNSIVNGVKLTKVVRRGVVQYENIPVLKGIDIEEFRKPPIEYWKVSA